MDHSKLVDNRKESKENQTRWIFKDVMVEDLIEALEINEGCLCGEETEYYKFAPFSRF